MKVLQKLADSIGGKVVILTFRNLGTFQRGYCIIDSDNNELLTLEPLHRSNGDRWLINNHCTKELSYCKDIRAAKSQVIVQGWTGYKFSGV